MIFYTGKIFQYLVHNLRDKKCFLKNSLLNVHVYQLTCTCVCIYKSYINFQFSLKFDFNKNINLKLSTKLLSALFLAIYCECPNIRKDAKLQCLYLPYWLYCLQDPQSCTPSVMFLPYWHTAFSPLINWLTVKNK